MEQLIQETEHFKLFFTPKEEYIGDDGHDAYFTIVDKPLTDFSISPLLEHCNGSLVDGYMEEQFKGRFKNNYGDYDLDGIGYENFYIRDASDQDFDTMKGLMPILEWSYRTTLNEMINDLKTKLMRDLKPFRSLVIENIIGEVKLAIIAERLKVF